MKNIAGAVEAYRNAVEIDPKGFDYFFIFKISGHGTVLVKHMSFKV